MDASTYNLNQGQKAAAEAFLKFLFDPEAKELIISGPAGVGKTYLMNYIIDNTMPRYHEMCQLMGISPEYDSVEMTATTNQAADVLGLSCKRPTQTVHSFFNLTVKENYSTGETELKKTNGWRVHERKIVFIDEASMIDTPLDKVIDEGTHKCKIVYVGDHNQLAPVKEVLSPIYRRNSPFYELTEPMRNKGQPALMNVCQQLRETVASGIFKPIRVVPGVIDWLDGPDMKYAIAQHFAKQTHDVRILAWTNERVMDFNDHIRSNLRNLPKEYGPGEFLVAASVYRQSNRTLSVQAEVEILRNRGSDFIEVESPAGDNPGVRLEVNYLDFVTTLGEVFTNVPFPVNRTHYAELLKWYAGVKGRNWERFWFLKNSFVDLRPRDASTVHKSQGSTYDTVFIDLGDISRCHIQNQAARMLYVAFSRARSRVFLYGNLADKYGGLILP